MDDSVCDELVADLKRENAFPMFITGAGVSLASGIPTFRGDDPDAVWANSVMEMGTLDKFQRDPVKQWQWYLNKFEACLGCEPNPGHFALAELEQHFLNKDARFRLVTQNVDGLHVQAGSQHVMEIHGAARKMRCSKRSCVHGAPRGFLPWDSEAFASFKAEPKFKNLPRCGVCNKLIRAHVLWFDETYDSHQDYGLDDLVPLLSDITLMVFVGTSFSVGITAMAMSAAMDLEIPVYVIDPNLTQKHIEQEIPGGKLIQAFSEEFLPRLVEWVRK